MTQLTEHFTLDELVRSQTAARCGIDNTPSPAVVKNLVRLCDEILEPLRKAVGKPLFVSSGYRCEMLNAVIGGAKDSDHLTGRAADIEVSGMSVEELAGIVKTLAPYVPLRQCILEFGKWVHVSCREPKLDANAPEFMVATLLERTTVYSPWVT